MLFHLPHHIATAAWPAILKGTATEIIQTIKEADADCTVLLDHPVPPGHSPATYAATLGLHLRPQAEVLDDLATLRDSITAAHAAFAAAYNAKTPDRALLRLLQDQLATAYQPAADTPTHALTLHYAGGTHQHTEKRTLASILRTLRTALTGSAVAAVITREDYAKSLLLQDGKLTPPHAQKIPTWPRPTHNAPATPAHN